MRVPVCLMLTACFFAVGTAGCSSSKQNEPTAGTSVSEAVATTVELAVAKNGTLVQTAELTGHLQAVDKAAVYSRLAGRVMTVNVRAGDKVVKGQPLLELDATTLKASEKASRATVSQAQANLLQAKASLEAAQAKAVQARESMGLTDSSVSIELQRVRQSVFQAEANTASAQADYNDAVHNMKRQRGLYANDAVSKYSVEQAELRESTARENLSAAKSSEKAARKAVEIAEANLRQVSISAGDVKSADAAVLQAQAGVEQAKAAVEQARASYESVSHDLRDTVLRSPCTGTVTARNVEPGQSVQASGGSSLLTVVDNSVLEMIAPLDERFRTQIKPGTRLTVTTAIAANTEAKVIDIIPASDPTSHSISVRLHIANPQGELVEGAYATAQLPVQTLTGVIIPRAGVNRSQEEVFVVVDNNGVAKKYPVKVSGGDEKNSVVVGLEAGMKVIVSGALDIGEGQKLKTAEEGK